MTTQATAVSAVELKAQIEALKAQAKAAAKAERDEKRAAAKAEKVAAKAAEKEVSKAERTALRELNKAHAEALKMNAAFDKAQAKAAAAQAEVEREQKIVATYNDLVAQLAEVGLTIKDFKRALPKLSAAQSTEAV
jgi:hypothetical protein